MTGRSSFEIEGYSHGGNPIPAVARIGNIIATGGISGVDLGNNMLPATMDAQCRNMFGLAAKILAAAGAGLDDVIKVTVFLKPEQKRDVLNTEWLRHFSDEHTRPVRHVLVNPYLPEGMLIQCEMMAVVS
jgi:2-iminobutanoate/2-iminopropanoate deaminase